MADAIVQLNPGPSSGGLPFATVTDGSGTNHQKTVAEIEVGGLPVQVSTGNPMPVAQQGIAAVGGNVASGGANAGNPVKAGGVYNSSPPTVGSGQIVDLQTDTNGFLKVNIAAGSNVGGTSSTFGASFPAVGTALGFKNSAGTLMQPGNLDASGNLNVNIQAGATAAVTDNNSAFTAGTSQGLPIALIYNDSATAAVSGDFALPRITSARQQRTVLDATANGGVTPDGYIAPATPAARAVKASAGQIYFMHCGNTNTTPVFLKVFNVASGSVTLGTTSANFQFMIPGSTGGAGYTVPIPQGIVLSTALTTAVTGAIALNDNTSITANTVTVVLGYA